MKLSVDIGIMIISMFLIIGCENGVRNNRECDVPSTIHKTSHYTCESIIDDYQKDKVYHEFDTIFFNDHVEYEIYTDKVDTCEWDTLTYSEGTYLNCNDLVQYLGRQGLSASRIYINIKTKNNSVFCEFDFAVKNR